MDGRPANDAVEWLELVRRDEGAERAVDGVVVCGGRVKERRRDTAVCDKRRREHSRVRSDASKDAKSRDGRPRDLRIVRDRDIVEERDGHARGNARCTHGLCLNAQHADGFTRKKRRR